MQYVAAQPGGQQVQPVNVVIAGPSDPAGQPQQTFMYGAPHGSARYVSLLGTVCNFPELNP